MAAYISGVYTAKGYARNWIGSYYLNAIQHGIAENGVTYSISDTGVETLLGTFAGNAWGSVQTDAAYRYTSTGNTIYQSYVGGSVNRSLDCGYPVRALGIDKTNAKLYVALSNGVIYSTRTSAFTLTAFLTVGADNFSPSMAVIGNYLYYARYGGQIHKVNLTTKVDTVLTKTPSVAWLCLATDGTRLFATVDGGYIYKIDINDVIDHKQILGDSAGRWWYGLSYNPATKSLWANAYTGLNYKIDIPVPAAPIFSTNTSTINNDISVTITGSGLSDDSAFYYTLDGSVPTSLSTVYTGPVTITKTTTLKAIVIDTGFESAITTADYTNTPPAPMKTILGDSGTWYSTYYYNGFIYAGDATALYKIDILTNAKTLLYTLGYIIYNVYVDGSFIYVVNGSMIYQLNMSGTLIASGDIGPTYAKVSSFVSYGGSLYVFLYNIPGSKYYYYYRIGVSGSWLYGTAIDCDIDSYEGAVNINNVIYVIKCMSDLSFNVYTVNPSNTTASLIGTTNSVTRISPLTAIICQATTDGTNIYVAVTGGGIYSINLSTFNLQILTNFNATSVRGLTYNPLHNSLIAGMYRNGIYEFAMVIGKSSSSIYSGGVWKTPNTKYVYTSGAWKPATKIFEVKNGVWLQVF